MPWKRKPPREKPRARSNVEKPEERIRDFREVEKGFHEEEAWYEAKRCLRCDLERAMREEESAGDMVRRSQ